MTTLMTASSQTTLLGCPRKYYWKYEVGLAPDSDALALRFGSAWARGMEGRWRGMSYEAALAIALPDNVDLDPVMCATLSGMLAGYYSLYGDAANDPNVAKLEPEVEFDLPLEASRSFRVAGKLDGLGVLWNACHAIVEHKTTSDSLEPDSDYWMRLRWNIQCLQYVHAARCSGWDISTVLYDVARKPSIRPKLVNKVMETPEQYADRLIADIKERPDFYFARREVPVLDQDVEEFKIQRLMMSRSILANRAMQKRCARPEQAWPRNISDNTCSFCPFDSFCLQNINININQPPAGFKIGKLNPELNAVDSTHTSRNENTITTTT